MATPTNTATTNPGGRTTFWVFAALVLLLVGVVASYVTGNATGEKKHHVIAGFAWDADEWAERSKGVRTSFNPNHDLSTTELTIVPGDPRWLDFLYWCFNNKIAEHQVEAYGGTEWDGPTGGVVFHWAPGSRWETHTLAGFGFTIGHTIGEHKWMDTQFPEFFERYGGVYGVNVKDRLTEIDATSPTPWVEFLEYVGGPNSPYYRYLFHQEAIVDPVREKVSFIGGQGVGFEYSFDRYYHEVREVLTDAKAFQFFQMYDLLGPGFASDTGWAKNKLNPELQDLLKAGNVEEWGAKPGVAKQEKYEPNPPSPETPAGLPDVAAIERGRAVYKQQCVPCHGAQGDGAGFLAFGLDVKPRDFRQGIYKFSSTKTGQLPTIEDIEKSTRIGVPDTTMPAWGQFLTPEQISDVSRYITIFSKLLVQEHWRNKKEPEKVEIPQVPSDLESLVAKGKDVYKLAACAKCHGDDGRGIVQLAEDMKDNWGQPQNPRDLTYKWVFANGYKPEDVYMTCSGGLKGTPMPSYDESLTVEQRWALVSYVLSLSPPTRPVIRLSEYKVGTAEIGKRLDRNGRVR
jgi:mono/diheme cytochrome c family protein